jgi:hypothetical protein
MRGSRRYVENAARSKGEDLQGYDILNQKVLVLVRVQVRVRVNQRSNDVVPS